MRFNDETRLSGKTIVITGASSGFGKGAARKFSCMGANLVLAARRDVLLNNLADECCSNGSRALPVHTDVSIEGDVDRLATTTVREFGCIDVWINDAGVGAIGRFEDIPLADHKKVIETNLLGCIYGSYFAMKEFRRNDSGILINVASKLGKVAAPYYSSYTASKFAIVGLDASLRQELRENNVENIRVCTLLPLAADTPFFDHAANYTGHEAEPIPPLYEPQDVVDALVDLAINPKDEVTIGGVGKFITFLGHVAPGVTEKLMARNTHKTQIQNAPVAKETDGSLLEPMMTGTEVSGGRLHH